MDRIVSYYMVYHTHLRLSRLAHTYAFLYRENQKKLSVVEAIV